MAMMRPPGILLLLTLAMGLNLNACSSGPLKWNQANKPAAVVDNEAIPKPKQKVFTVLIVPSGAIKTNYISDKTSTAGGILGSMVVGPIAGAVGSLVASTAGSTAAASAEENASRNIDSSDIAQAIAPRQLPQYFVGTLGDKLAQCGIGAVIYPTLLNPANPDWSTTHLTLPSDFMRDAEPHRFFVEANILGIQLRGGLKDDTMEGDAYARVYETRSLRQIGRYAYKTGSSGSVTLHAYSNKNPKKTIELQKAATQVAQYLAGGIANDMCTIMARL